MHVHPPPLQPERLVMRNDGAERGGGGRSAKNVHPPRQNPRYAPDCRCQPTVPSCGRIFLSFLSFHESVNSPAAFT
jgi:hypothetical protein